MPCRRETSITAGTIFEGTRKPLRTWFLAMWFVTSQKNGVSALGLQRALGLGSYETSWTWLHKLRRAMVRPGRDRLAGEIEADETYVGGPEEGKRGRAVERKAIVAVAAEPTLPALPLPEVALYAIEAIADIVCVEASPLEPMLTRQEPD